MTRIIHMLRRRLGVRMRNWGILAMLAAGVGVWAATVHTSWPNHPEALHHEARPGRQAYEDSLPEAGGSGSSSIPSTAVPVSSDGNPTCIEVRLGDYNLFLLGDYNQGSDVQGKVAVGGEINLNNFAVGAGLPDGNTALTLVAGGNLNLSNGAVHGDAWYGGSYIASSSVTFSRGVASQGMPIDFSTLGADLRRLSSQLASLTANGTTTRESWGGIMLRGTDPQVNVFDVDASAFTGAVLFSLDAPVGSLAVINIRGPSATLQGGHSFSGGIDQHGVLYNFVDTTTLNAQGYGFWGTVLAPYADIHFTNGSFDGGIYAKSLTGNAEGHINSLNDRDICGPAGPSNTPPTVVITSPATGTPSTAPATVRVAATASDSDGTVTKVEFFRNGLLVGTATSAPYAVTLTGIPAGTHRLTARATDDGGASTLSAAVEITVKALALTITSPINGASLQGDHVLVKGDIDGLSNCGVMVNGVVATVDASNHFYADVPVVAGGNTLTAMLTAPDGPTLSRSVTVIATGQPLPFTVAADPNVGMAPLAVTLTVTNRSEEPASYTLDGFGPFPLPAGGSSALTMTYPAGVFTPTVVMTNSAGSFSQALVIEAREASQMDQLFGAIWDGMNRALLMGDKDKAMTYLNSGAQAKFGPVFDVLLPHMPEIIASYSPLTRASISSKIGEYAIRRPSSGGYRLYFIYFLQGADGVWRIDEM